MSCHILAGGVRTAPVRVAAAPMEKTCRDSGWIYRKVVIYGRF